MERTNSDDSILAFYGVPRIKKHFHITQDSSPWDVFEIFFSPEMFKTYTEGNKLICESANQQKEARGPSETQTCICTVEFSLNT